MRASRVLALLLCGTLRAATPEDANPYSALLDHYCVGCHNVKSQTGGLTLEGADLTDVSAHPAIWEKVIRKLRTNAMPPPGLPRPNPSDQQAFLTWLETSIDRAAATEPNPGRTITHRLNRTEYANAVRDLIGIEIDGAAFLPPDDSGFGFDNIGDVLSISPMLTERYLAAARKISRAAVGDPAIRPATESFEIDKYMKQDDRVDEDVPFGSRGGLAVHAYFPMDGDYVVKVFLQRTYEGLIRGLAEPHQIEVRLNGRKLKQFSIGGTAADTDGRPRVIGSDPEAEAAEIRFHAKAGPAVLAVDYVKELVAPEGMLRPKYPVNTYEYAGDVTIPPGIGRIELRGPYDVTGASDSPSRRRIFVCRPANPAEEPPCARKILVALARHAYRRPVSDGDLQPLMRFFRQGRENGTFDGGIELALERILMSPDFLFHVELEPPKAQPGTAYRVSDLDVASRLSFFLWSSIPDDELLRLAERGRLREPEILDRQVRRMLADTRSKAFIANFTGQWLYVRNIRMLSPDPYTFPDFDSNLREAFARELELFLESQVREDHSIMDLLTADYTFVNERLARHYGIPNIYGSHFRRVTLTDEYRKGLLGKGGILMVTSYPNRTSPVLRGKWLLQNILGAPPPSPPPTVPALGENVPGMQPFSVRERLEQHRRNPACASCHALIDPLGFALENFDATGAWRDRGENGKTIDSSATLIDGTRVAGPASLRKALVDRQEDFSATVAEKLLTYALGRGIEPYDAPAIRKIVREAAAENDCWSAMIRAVVRSAPFQLRMPAQSVE
jgi:hypothetical protein